MNNYQVLSPQHLPLILLMSLWLLTPQKVSAGAIEISIDPYNDSGYETIPLESNQSPNDNTHASPKPNLSVIDKENISSEGIYYVKGNSPPPPPQIVDGNLIQSNQSLPPIPPLNEPYSPQQTADVNPRNITPTNELSVSVSPLNVTPSTENTTSNNAPTTNKIVLENSNNSIRNISVSPQNSNSNSVSVNNNSNNSSMDNLGKRRNLREILVFSNSTNSENIKNNGNNMPSESLQSSSNNSQTVYKVLAKTNGNNQEVGVKSLYPEAFKTNYQGQSLLQVGVFSTQENAEQVSQSLANIGVKAIILK